MIKFKKNTDPLKQAKNEDKNRLNQITELASEKRSKPDPVPRKRVDPQNESKLGD